MTQTLSAPHGADEINRADLPHPARRLLRFFEEVLIGDVVVVNSHALACQVALIRTVYDAPVIVVSAGATPSLCKERQPMEIYRPDSGVPRLRLALWLHANGVSVADCTHYPNKAGHWRFNVRTNSFVMSNLG